MHKKVSLFIPLSVIGLFSVAQAMLGASPVIVVMCAAAVALPFSLLRLYGRDLYGLLGISFSVKYVGFALAAKTFYGQTLESHLYDPYAAFELTLLLMAILTAVLIVARALDPGKALFAFPMDLAGLRRLSLACICIGIAGNFAYSGGVADTGAPASGGAGVVLGAAFREYYYFGLIAESVYAALKTNGRSFITGRLVVLFLIQALISISFNERGALASGLIAVATVAYLYDMLKIRHVVAGTLVGCFFIFIFTPVTIYLRSNKEGLSFSEFVELAESTITKAATEPDFFKLISETQKSATFQNANVRVPYDYYGVRSEVLDRLSFVSLVDAVYNGTRTREPLGMEAVDQTLARVAPGFLGYDKEITMTGPGDWLSWQTGLLEPGRVMFAVFGLPMEGLATWGLIGMIVYPFLFMLPVLYICGRLSSFRLPFPLSVYLFVVIQHFMLDTTSDVYLVWLSRNLPVLLVSLFVLHHFVPPRRLLPHIHVA